MALTIGIDSGTQSTKAIVWDRESGTVVAQAQVPHELISGLGPGHMEQHPADWVRALEIFITGPVAEIMGLWI